MKCHYLLIYETKYLSSGDKLTLDNNNLTVAFTDLWYYELDENPIQDNEHVHNHFASEIDHFVIAIEFRGS